MCVETWRERSEAGAGRARDGAGRAGLELRLRVGVRQCVGEARDGGRPEAAAMVRGPGAQDPCARYSECGCGVVAIASSFCSAHVGKTDLSSLFPFAVFAFFAGRRLWGLVQPENPLRYAAALLHGPGSF